MSEDLHLAEGGAPDVADVMRVMDDAFLPAFGEAWTHAQCLGILDLPRVWLTVARHGEEPAGFALSRIVIDEAELLLLAVRPAFRRRGVATALVERTLTIAATAGARKLHLEVRDGNEALHLYMRSGFDQDGRRRGYYRGRNGQLFDALSLSRQLIRQDG